VQTIDVKKWLSTYHEMGCYFWGKLLPPTVGKKTH